MKSTFLILVAMFLVFDCSWAKEKDAGKFLLSGNHAKSFLKSQNEWNICKEVHLRSCELGYDIDEECCGEPCDPEEFDEIYGSMQHNPEQKREQFLDNCC